MCCEGNYVVVFVFALVYYNSCFACLLELFPIKKIHTEMDPVIPGEASAREPMRRKVASTASAPTYKGRETFFVHPIT